MGEPAEPTEAERAQRRELARAVVEAVTNDEPIALPIDVFVVHEAGEHYQRVDADRVAFRSSPTSTSQRVTC